MIKLYKKQGLWKVVFKIETFGSFEIDFRNDKEGLLKTVADMKVDEIERLSDKKTLVKRCYCLGLIKKSRLGDNG